MKPRIRPRARVFAAWILCSLLVVLMPPPGHAQHDERAVRAAFVFNLTKYVEWPRTRSEVVIGFAGDDGFGETLQRVIAGKSSNGRVIRVLLSPSDEQLQQCDVAYIGFTSAGKIRDTLGKIRGKGVLTVGEKDSFARDGGMVALVRVGDEIQIQINVQAAESEGLKISSRLLNLALIVRSGGGN